MFLLASNVGTADEGTLHGFFCYKAQRKKTRGCFLIAVENTSVTVTSNVNLHEFVIIITTFILIDLDGNEGRD